MILESNGDRLFARGLVQDARILVRKLNPLKMLTMVSFGISGKPLTTAPSSVLVKQCEVE